MKKIVQVLTVSFGLLAAVVGYHFYSEQDLQRRVSDQDRRVTNVEATVDEQGTQLRETTQDVKNHEERISVLETAIQKTDQQLAATQAKVHAQQEKISTLDASRQADRAEIEKIRQDLDALQSLHVQLQGEHARLARRIEAEKEAVAARIKLIEDKIGLTPDP